MDGSLSLAHHFSSIPDPRMERTRRHKLDEILVIAICAMLCGAESFVEMEEFGHCKEEWLRQRLELPGGIPSHDTFNRVFGLLDPEEFGKCFMRWVEALQEYLKELRAEGEMADQFIALDGKTVRHSFDTASGKAAIHMVSAWSAVNSLTLGQIKVNDKSNEITAIPALLQLLDVAGAIVTIDAMGTQKEIARQIVEQGGDYILPVKENHPTLHHNIEQFFAEEEQAKFKGQIHEVTQTSEKDHGRIEKRRAYLVPICTTVEAECPKQADALMNWLDPKREWSGLETIGMIIRQREVNGKITTERQYYISSLSGGVERFSRAARGHWGIENVVHWSLDVSFNEDLCRVRLGHAAENLATLRRIALNLIKQETSRKVGVKVKRRKAGWDDRYLQMVLAGPPK
ncbi:MAG TPA: ISAs1 family transposase [Armatimonadota bacterium]|nr:ISAs1 family transposase [Armatimonadota bacterium]